MCVNVIKKNEWPKKEEFPMSHFEIPSLIGMGFKAW